MAKTGRNDPCPCGSGKKYKKCCEKQDEAVRHAKPTIPPSPIEGEWDPYDGDGNHKIRYAPFVHWSKEEIEEFETEEIVRRLGAFGIPFDEAAFRVDAQRCFSAEDLSERWMETYDFQPVERRDTDFPWFACMVLWDRLCPEIPYGEQLDDLMQEGYDHREGDRREKACDVWLTVWQMVSQRFAPGHRSVEELDKHLHLYQYLLNWCQDLEAELGSAGFRTPSYYEKQIAYCTEFARLLPETDENILLNMRKAAAKAWFGLGNPSRGEEEFRRLTAEHPDWVWGYIGWGDAYVRGDYRDLDRAESIYRMAHGKGDEGDERDLAQRLEVLAEEKGKLGCGDLGPDRR